MEQWRIGDVTVTRIVEMEMAGGTRFILPQATPEAVAPYEWMKPHFVTEEGKLVMSIHALIVDTPSARIMVDTCLGNDKQGRMAPIWNDRHEPFLERMAEAGYPASSIDMVMCTHLHVDHVGWNTMLKDGEWVPTFPQARYLMARPEFEHWRFQSENEEQLAVFADSVKPVFDAGLVDLVEMNHRLCDEVSLVPTVGHTPGHVSVRISSKGEEALITGDFIHHPCQFARPDWASSADVDSTGSTATRERMFENLAETSVLVIGTHFAAPTAGYVKREGKAYRLDI